MRSVMVVMIMIVALGALAFAQDLIRFEYTSDNLLDLGMVVKVDPSGNNKILPCVAATDIPLGVVIAYVDKGGTRVYAIQNSGNGLASLASGVAPGTPLTWDNAGYLVPMADPTAVGEMQVATATDSGLGGGGYSRIMIDLQSADSTEFQMCCEVIEDTTGGAVGAIDDTVWTTLATWTFTVNCDLDSIPVSVILNAEVSDTGSHDVGAIDSVRLVVNGDISNADVRRVVLLDQDYHGTDNFEFHKVQTLPTDGSYQVSLQAKVGASPARLYDGGVIKVSHLEISYCRH